MEPARLLTVVADDFGIGPDTSRAILELAQAGVVTATVLLVNSPYAESAVKAWKLTKVTADLGWHPCLTMDAPTAAPHEVFSLLDAEGRMGPLGRFLRRVLLRQIQPGHIRRELHAQLDRFRELTGGFPRVVNSHQHVALFPPVGAILRDVLRPLSRRPFLRQVAEPWSTYAQVPGARIKRAVLTLLGRGEARRQRREGFPGAQWMAGVTDPVWVQREDFFARWLSAMPGEVVELMCHPGYFDPTLVGRDCRADDGLQQRRVDEFHLLRQPAFLEACRKAGFSLRAPSELGAVSPASAAPRQTGKGRRDVA